MSVAAGKGPSSSPAELKPQVDIQPVPILDGAAAKSVALAQPAILLGLLVASFGELVKDPVTTLQTGFPVVAVLQVAYVTLCLPPAGSPLGKPSKAAKKARTGDRKKADATSPNIVLVGFSTLYIISYYVGDLFPQDS
jgi:phosphatidylinositol glycan class F